MVPTLLSAVSNKEYAINTFQGQDNNTIPNTLVFRMIDILLKANLEIFRKNAFKARGFSRNTSSSQKSSFGLFLYRLHDFLITCMSSWRRDYRVSIGDLGFIIYMILNPLDVPYTFLTPSKMVSKHGRTITIFDEGGFDRSIDSNPQRRSEDKESFLAKRLFLETYLSEFVLVHCHLMSCFVMTFSQVADIVSDHDTNVLNRILDFYTPTQDTKGDNRLFLGSIKALSYKEFLDIASKDSRFLESKRI